MKNIPLALTLVALVIIFATALIYILLPTKAFNLSTIAPIDYILIEKQQRKMTVFSHNKAIKSYKIALGFQPSGHKQKEGDGKTPEGFYTIVAKNPKSKFYLSLKISYPSAQDLERSQINKFNPGGNIMIHGLPFGFGWLGKYHLLIDWTRGCIAINNEEIAEIYPAVKLGTITEIRK